MPKRDHLKSKISRCVTNVWKCLFLLKLQMIITFVIAQMSCLMPPPLPMPTNRSSFQPTSQSSPNFTKRERQKMQRFLSRSTCIPTPKLSRCTAGDIFALSALHLMARQRKTKKKIRVKNCRKAQTISHSYSQLKKCL